MEEENMDQETPNPDPDEDSKTDSSFSDLCESKNEDTDYPAFIVLLPPKLTKMTYQASQDYAKYPSMSKITPTQVTTY